MVSDDRLLIDFSDETVVLYFCAIDHNVSPLLTLYDEASVASAPTNAEATAAVAVADKTIFLFANVSSSYDKIRYFQIQIFQYTPTLYIFFLPYHRRLADL
jgi:hypothetical protein